MARPLGVNPDDEQDSDDVTPALAIAQIGHAGTVESKEALARRLGHLRTMLSNAGEENTSAPVELSV